MTKAIMNSILSTIASIDTPEADAIRVAINAELAKGAEKAQGSAKSKVKKGIKEKADAKKAKPTKSAKPAKKTEKPAKARRRAARAGKKDDLPNSAVWPDPKSKRKK